MSSAQAFGGAYEGWGHSGHHTWVFVSPCGRFTAVIDDLPPNDIDLARWWQTPDLYIAQVTIVEAASGKILHCHTTNEPIGPVSWSSSGQVCLIHEHAVMLCIGEDANAPFRQLQLSHACQIARMEDDQPDVRRNLAPSVCQLSLSPCGRMVIGLNQGMCSLYRIQGCAISMSQTLQALLGILKVMPVCMPSGTSEVVSIFLMPWHIIRSDTGLGS